LEKQMKDVTVSVSDASENMINNMGRVTKAQVQDFQARLAALNQQYTPKGGMVALTAEAASALSASQSNRPATLAAMEAAIRFAPASAETREQVAGGILDLRKATGVENPMANLGLLKAIGEQSRVTEWAKIAKNLTGGVLGVKEYGGTAQQAGALIAAITQASADVEGRRSATAAINLVEQLARYLPEKDVMDYALDPATMQYKKVVKAKGTGLKDWQQRIAYLRRNPEEMERVLGSLSSQAKQKAAVRQIVMGRGAGAEAFVAASAAMDRPLGQFAAGAEEMINVRQSLFGSKIAGMERGGEALPEVSAETVWGKKQALLGAYSLGKLETVLQQHGVGPIRRRGMNINWFMQPEWTGDQMDAIAGRRRFFQSEVRNQLLTLRYGIVNPEPGRPISGSPEELQLADNLERWFKRQEADAEETLAEIRRQTAILERNQASAGAAQAQLGVGGEK
ncbi:MAG TPA: hypothetical protein VMW52_11735, partial [Phycisphaerae bacterium]|nr:hypothetical protein [Phycisphaerae bacterium]